MDWCGPQNEASFEHLKDTGILCKYHCNIKVTVWFHPFATMVYNEIETEVRQARAVFRSVLQRSRYLEAIYEEKDKLKETAIYSV